MASKATASAELRNFSGEDRAFMGYGPQRPDPFAGEEDEEEDEDEENNEDEDDKKEEEKDEDSSTRIE